MLFSKAIFWEIVQLFQGKSATLLHFVGYCDLASFKKVHPENKKLSPENTGQPKSARAFCCLGLWKMKISHFP